MSKNSNIDFQRELVNARLDYISKLPDILNNIEALLKDVSGKKKGEVHHNLIRLNQVIHGLKGTCGSFEIKFISTACNNFIDKLRLLFDESDSEIIDVDFFHNVLILMKSYVGQIAIDGNSEIIFGEKLSEVTSPDRIHRVLLVEKEQNIIDHFKDLFLNLGIDFSVEHSGQEAFVRLLNEKFDSLITDIHTGIVDGPSLIAISKVVNGPNKNIFTVLLSTSDHAYLPASSIPNRVIEKGENVLSHIEEIYVKLLSHTDEDLTITGKLLNVLAVDDDPAIRKLLGISFKGHAEANLTVCQNSQEVYEHLKNGQFNLVILDVMLEGESGFDILKEMRGHPEWKKIPVIFLSAKDYELDGGKLYSEGVLGWISKPFRPKDLAGHIEKIFIETFGKLI